jgi:hypothetical protein
MAVVRTQYTSYYFHSQARRIASGDGRLSIERPSQSRRIPMSMIQRTPYPHVAAIRW